MYKLIHERFENQIGTVVYPCRSHDYGMSSDDTRYTGVHHISVTLNKDGDYPFFTVPVTMLEKYKETV